MAPPQKAENEEVKEKFRLAVKSNYEALHSRGLSPGEAAAVALKMVQHSESLPPAMPSLLQSMEALCTRDSDAHSSATASESRGGDWARCGSAQEAAMERVRHDVAAVFASPHALSIAFYDTQQLTPNAAGLDFGSIRRFYSCIEKLGDAALQQCVMGSTQQVLEEAVDSGSRGADNSTSSRLIVPVSSTTLIRCLLVMLENPMLMEPEHHSVLKSIASHLTAVEEKDRALVKSTFASFNKAALEQVVSVVQQFVTIQLYDTHNVTEAVQRGVKLLGLLYDGNKMSRLLPLSAFHNDAVNNTEFVNIDEDFRRWQNPERYAFTFCGHPYVYDAANKAHFLHLDSRTQRNAQFHNAILQGIFTGHLHPYLVLRVRRDNIIHDAISEMQRSPEDLKKPLKVQFIGEEGVDEGGVQKEFFQLVVREIFDPKYGMFSYSNDTHQFWFSFGALHDSQMEYELIGMVLGLAIYNGNILELRLPTVVYKKLIGHDKPDLFDLEGVNPGLAKGLRDLLEFDGDVEEVYARNFQVTMEDVFGDKTAVDLKEGGADIPLTNRNRKEYVDLCVDFYLNKSVEKQFVAFSKGFRRLCDGRTLELFEAEDLELLACGSPVLDFDELERTARYEDGYTSDSSTIRDFWKVVHGLSDSEKRNLLTFVTGCDRVPIKGLASLPFVISRNGPDSDRLPTAHTCYNHLLLPEYSSFEKLQDRLRTAINNAEGFGLL